MIHSMEKQLQVVLRALTDVVAPSLTGVDKHVVEQLHLSIATLSFVAARLPDARRFYRHELAAYLDLAEQIADAARGHVAAEAGALHATVVDGRALLMRADADIAEYEEATRDCREAIAALSGADGLGAARWDVDRIILAGSEAIIAQSRQWCTPFGFELKPQDLPPPAW